MSLLLVGMSQKTFTKYMPHYHKHYEIILNLEGEGAETIGGRKYPFFPGSIHIIPPGMPHQKESFAGFRDIYFRTDMLYLGSNTSLNESDKTLPVILHDDADKTMEKLLTILLSRYLNTSKNDIILNSMYHTILQLINEWYERDSFDPLIDSMIHSITVSFNDPEFSITDALLETGFSKDYVRRCFVTATGMTPNEYLVHIRMNYAVQLLRQKKLLNLSISEISTMCGYYDPRYFSRVFKKHFGASPSEYKSFG